MGARRRSARTKIKPTGPVSWLPISCSAPVLHPGRNVHFRQEEWGFEPNAVQRWDDVVQLTVQPVVVALALTSIKDGFLELEQLAAVPKKEWLVTGFTFTVQDLRSAPTEVRRWLVGRIEEELMPLAYPPAPPAHATQLAACTSDEAVAILDLLRGDFAATHVFLELARGEAQSDASMPLHAVSIAAVIRNTRIDEHQLASCLQAINRAFQTTRQDPEATLFAFDQGGHVYVHETTYRSIRSLWQELVRLHAPTEAKAAKPIDWTSFQPRQLGPTEDITTHQQY